MSQYKPPEQVHQLQLPDPATDLSHVGAILQGIHKELRGELPVLGFAGAPVTLAFFVSRRIPSSPAKKDSGKSLKIIPSL